MQSTIFRSYLTPAKILWLQGNVKDSKVLLCPGCGQPSVRKGPSCAMIGQSSMLIDFGQEFFGGLQIITAGTTEDRKPVKVRIRLGESVSEAMNSPENDHGINDDILHVAWMGLTEFGKTGFRFARIDLLDENSRVELREIRGISYLRQLDRIGTFECSDDRLNRIWDVSVRTVHLNMQEYMWDGIKRDRLVWIGDMHPEISVISAVFGNVEVVSKSLDFVRDETLLPEFMNGINAYSMWWILIHHHWHMWYGDLGYLKQQEGYLLELLSQLEQYVDDSGKENLPDRRFVDWLTKGDDVAIHVGLQSLLAMTFNAAADLFDILGHPQKAELYRGIYKKICGYRLPATMNKSVSALCVLAGISDAKQTNQNVLSNMALNGLSPFYGYYVLQARAAAGDYQGCIDLIRNYWGGMLDLGATTMWEHFDINWLENAGRIDELPTEDKVDVHKTYGDHCYKSYRHSLCHGWSGGPAAWLIEHVLGVSPEESGFRKVSIQPYLADLEWAKGTVPTPHGLIEITHIKDNTGKIKTEYKLPSKIKKVL